MDGYAAALAAWLRFGDNDNIEYLPVNYGESPPDVSRAEVYILDFSYPRETLLRMKRQASSLLVLDHHKTAQEALRGLDFAQFDMSRSGCMMAYQHFFPNFTPSWIFKWIQDRDLWQFKHPQTKAFDAALRALVPREFSAWEKYLNDNNAYDLVHRGEDLLRVFDADIEALLTRKHPISLLGASGLAVNAIAKYASELGNRLALESGTFGLVYSYAGDRKVWDCSLRSVGDYDVSKLAQQFGGGGHKNASGFNLIELSGI